LKRPAEDDILIHGLVFDQQWQYEVPVVGQDFVSVTTYIEITPESPFYKHYPFDSRFSLNYALRKDGVSISYKVSNHGSKDMPFGFALHPYFSTLSGKDNTLVTVPANSVMEADNKLLPTGRILPLDGIMYAMFDLRQPVPIAHLKLDHVYTDLRKNESAIIEYKKQAMQLRISASSEFTHVVMFTPPPEADGPFFCLENQTCSTDAINLHARGLNKIAHLLEVPPGETSTGSIEYKLVF
jgi:aldose 1-epimerase